MTYTGQLPATGTVLWSLLATNSDGETLQLSYKTLDGETSAYFWSLWSEGTQHNFDDFGDIRTPGESQIVMYMPNNALAQLGPTWSWQSVINVDGEDIDSC